MEQSFATYTIAGFCDALAAETAAPGGGSTAAVVAALAASLAEMVARLTSGRPKFVTVDASMQQVITAAQPLRQRLLDLADADAVAFAGVMAAFRLSKETDIQKHERQAAIQIAYQQATTVPMQTLETAVEVLALCLQVVENGNPNAVTDGATGALLAEAAAQGAALNVRVNLAAIQDREFADAMQTQLYPLLARASELRTAALRHVLQHLPAA